MKLITMKGVTKLYSKGDHEQRALDSVDLEIDEGKFVVILGRTVRRGQEHAAEHDRRS